MAKVFVATNYSQDERRWYAEMFTDGGKDYDPDTTGLCPTEKIARREAKRLIEANGDKPAFLRSSI